MLRIGASDMTLRFYLLDHIAEFHRRYPAVRLTVTNAPSPRTLAALSDGAIDFGVVSGPLGDLGEGITLIPVRAVQDIFIAAPTHPLAGEACVTREALAPHPMLMLEGNTSTRSYLEGWLGRDFPPPAIELATSALLLEFVKRGIGIAPITEDFAASALASGEVVSLALSDPLPPRELYLAYSSRLPLSAAARRMLELLAEARGET
jgi:DNA-binding transcriptional LysR family regulator